MHARIRFFRFFPCNELKILPYLFIDLKRERISSAICLFETSDTGASVVKMRIITMLLTNCTGALERSCIVLIPDWNPWARKKSPCSRLQSHLIHMMLWKTYQNQHQFNAYRIARFKITIINYPLHLIHKKEPSSTKKVFVMWHHTFWQGFIL